MRIPKSWIGPMAKRVAHTLLSEDMVVHDVDEGVIAAEVERLILEELHIEDRLNDEVRQILLGHDRDIDRNHLDYRKLFDLTKQKLVRERGIVI